MGLDVTEAGGARYPGARSFGDDQLSRALFFGRDAESSKLLNQVVANRLVVVYARSGLGKTSLLKAGIAEGLRNEGFLPLMVRVNDIGGGPLKSVLLDIQSEAQRQHIEYLPGGSESLWHFFKTAQFWQGDRLMTPVLVLDQFEELFTLHERARRDVFLDQVGSVIRGVRPTTPCPLPLGAATTRTTEEAVSSTEPQVRIVIGIREDYLGFLDEGVEQIPHILHQRLRLTPLTVDSAREAIMKPAALRHADLRVSPFEYADGTVSAIVAFLAKRSTSSSAGDNSFVDPFQLQLVCQRAERLAEARGGKDNKVVVAFADLGREAGLHQVLTNFYLTRLDGLPGARDRRNVRFLCERMLISSHGHRLSIEEAEILRATKIERAVLDRLVDERLLRSDRRADSVYYELSHDTLVEPILSTRRGSQKAIGWTYTIAGGVSVSVGILLLFICVVVSIGVIAMILTGQAGFTGFVRDLAALALVAAYGVPGLVLLVGGRVVYGTGRDLLRRYRISRVGAKPNTLSALKEPAKL